jgi:chromosome segregation protein
MERKRQLQAELLALRIRDLDSDIAGRHGLASQRETETQAAIAELRAAEAAVERARAAHMERSDTMTAVQWRYYQSGADVTRTEQALQHARELRQRQRADLERVNAEHAEASLLADRDQAHLAELSQFLEQAEPDLAAAQARESCARATLTESEAEMSGWQQRWETFSQATAEATRGAEVEQARVEQIESGLQRLHAQRERLERERSHLASSIGGAKPEEFAAAENEARERGREAQAALETALSSLQSLRDAEREGAAALDAAKAELQSARSEFLTVEAVQKAALGRGQAGTAEWLTSCGLDSRPRLAQQHEVDKGW